MHARQIDVATTFALALLCRSTKIKLVTGVQIHKKQFLRRSISSSTLVLALDHQPELSGFSTLVIIREHLSALCAAGVFFGCDIYKGID